MQHVPLRVRHFLQVGEPQGRSASPVSLVFAYGIDGEKRGLEGFPQRAILNPEGQDRDYFTREITRSQSPPMSTLSLGSVIR
ncbi:MAG: hypothetical protein V7K98_02715 [Nostoc sp.]|uniref:hypothetical protein n=1 Tax=Nostoc sp. TaxID=1180 RepID=UPI002FFD4944